MLRWLRSGGQATAADYLDREMAREAQHTVLGAVSARPEHGQNGRITDAIRKHLGPKAQLPARTTSSIQAASFDGHLSVVPAFCIALEPWCGSLLCEHELDICEALRVSSDGERE
jgi:hypothetical protein